MKKIVYFLAILFTGCIHEDFQDTFQKSTLGPEYSMPVGIASYNINDEFDRPPSDIPGDYGLIYFENDTFTLNTYAYSRGETKDLNLRITADSYKNIERVTFHVIIKNSFPTDVTTQIRLLGSNGEIIDSLFNDNANKGPLKIPGGEIDANGIVQKESVRVIDIPFTKDKIENLQNVAFYESECYIYTKKSGLSKVQFFNTCQLYISVGVRIKLKLGGDQL